ncbi:MBL fold metallo-hydrolase [Myxococcus sp. 1LA]
MGCFIELPGEPSVYIAGDTLLTDAVRTCITERRPDLAIVPAGGARFDAGGDILMNGDDVLELARLTTGRVFANHLEALDHCPTTRERLRAAARMEGLEHKLLVPEDGERYTCPPPF